MKAARPQAAGSGPNVASGRKRYFVNFVTKDQILEFQNDVSSKQSVPLLAPGKRENRLLILAPNTETIDSFQKRALTQFQYSTNVSADAVKLLESHFCEVPRSYSVSDALDARSETYLVVENVKVLGPVSKRRGPDSPRTLSSSSPSSPAATPRGEPSSKRLRRREKQAVKLASLEVDGAESRHDSLNSAQSYQPSQKSAASSQDALKTNTIATQNLAQEPFMHTSTAHKPLFGLSRAESERKPSMSLNGKPDFLCEQANHDAAEVLPAAASPVRQAGTKSGRVDAGGTVTLAAEPVATKPKRVRTATAIPAAAPPSTATRAATQHTDPSATGTDAAETSENKTGVKPNRGARHEESTKSGISSSTGSNGRRINNEMAKKDDDSDSKMQQPSVATKHNDHTTITPAEKPGKKSAENIAEASKSANVDEGKMSLNGTETHAESEMSTSSADSEDSDSSASESDSGERLRRLSRRRVVAVPNGTTNETKLAARESKSKQLPGSAPSEHAPTTPKREPPASKPQPQRNPTVNPEATESEKPAATSGGNSGGNSRVPGLGSLADLANMRLPTVHEQNHKTASASAKKPVEEESSEEEEDNNESDDSNESGSSSSGSSDSSDDEDTSTAGRKNRKRGLLGLLGTNK